jgi:hypothetical protein
MRKGSAPKPEEDAEEAVKFLAGLAAKIAPGLCLDAPRQAIEAAARLIKCAREHLAIPGGDDEKARLADEKAQLQVSAKHADKYGFKLTGGNLSFADGFVLQKDPRVSEGKRREGPYKTEASFVAALRREKLTWRARDGAPEETTPKAVGALFEILRERQLEKDAARKKRVK